MTPEPDPLFSARPLPPGLRRAWEHPAVSAGWGLAAALLFWMAPSSLAADFLIWGAFLWALPRWRRGAAIWRTAPGLAAILIALYAAASIPGSVDPAASAGDLLKDLRLAAGAFVLSVLAPDPRRAERTLLLAVFALLPVFAADLLRLMAALGPAFPAMARYHEPHALNHPNVSSLLAGFACLVCACGGWTRRTRPWAAAGYAAGAGLSLVYLVVMASRGPQVAFAAAAGAGLVLIPRTWKGRAAGLILALLAAGLIVAFLPRINARFAQKDDIFTGRLTVWRHTAKLTQAHPWLGYGYGKKTFQAVYAGSHPPPSPFTYPHPHQYALFVLFQGGRAWLILHAALWILLAVRLIRAMGRTPDDTARLRLAMAALLCLLVHVYGLGDYPDNRLRSVMVALVPLAVAVSGGAPVQTAKNLARTSG